MTIWNLIPIPPFNEDDIRYKSTSKPLKVPASLGREELLRPFHCCIKKKSPKSAKKKKEKGPCHVCKSIQDIAKFIPRKDFWCLSSVDAETNIRSIGSSSRLQLIISGKNIAQLVRICSSSGVVRELDKKLDEQTIHVYDGDILSLLWYKQLSSSSEGDASKTSSSKLETLVQFRLTKVNEDEEDETMNIAAKEESLSDNKVQVSILVDNSQERAAIENNGISNMMSDTKITAAESRDDRDSAKIDQGKDDDDESMQSDTDDLLYTQEDQIKQEDMHDDDNDSKKSAAGVSFQGSSRKLVDDVSAAVVPPCIGSVKSSSKDEYESSAPLTLPYEFLASGGESKSYSFDSMDKSPTKLPIDKKNPSTPQKSNVSSKRRYEDVASTDQDTKVVSKTPKKSNVTATDKSSQESTLLSSLTHNEMVKLHEQSAPQTTDTKPSLRHTVLSLTLALTSNASAYDSNFLRDCNVETTPNGNGQRSGERQDVKQKWMPRFLQGTKIKDARQ